MLSQSCAVSSARSSTTMTRAEWHRRRRKERARKARKVLAFLASPFGFTKQLLGQKRSGQLTSPKSEIDSYLRHLQ